MYKSATASLLFKISYGTGQHQSTYFSDLYFGFCFTVYLDVALNNLT